ncbi:MAG: N-acyl homoserine lactonase family protein [Gemmatimonadetes bacterium]|nr:N-acyl homoserine lactonase family protein [Gemmatimonadota bacterium]
MKIHAIKTGTVQVHERQRTGTGRGPLRFANTLFDSNWSEPLPILAWVVEHPEGILVVDTGETARAGESGYFPAWHPYFRWGLREQVHRQEEIGPQLERLGIRSRDVRWVVMTHLHTDHAGGLSHFPDSEILVSAREHQDAQGFVGKARGYLPNRWPVWFAPTRVEFRPEPFGPFVESHVLTSAGDVHLVPTPGHTRGHLSVALDLGDQVVFFAGDTSYTEANLHGGIVDGVSSLGGGVDAAARSLQRIRDLASMRDVVYLPSHDPESASRLAEALTSAVHA